MDPIKALYQKVYRWVAPLSTPLSAVVVNGTSLAFDVSQWGNVAYAAIGAGTAAGTIKCKVSLLASDVVDFSAASTAANPWSYVALFDYETAGPVNGASGIVFAADAVKQGEINAGAARSIAFELSARTGGNFTVKIAPVNNQ